MALKYTLKSKEEIPGEFQSLHVEREGGFVLDAEGAVDRAKLDEFRANNVALLKQLDDRFLLSAFCSLLLDYRRFNQAMRSARS